MTSGSLNDNNRFDTNKLKDTLKQLEKIVEEIQFSNNGTTSRKYSTKIPPIPTRQDYKSILEAFNNSVTSSQSNISTLESSTYKISDDSTRVDQSYIRRKRFIKQDKCMELVETPNEAENSQEGSLVSANTDLTSKEKTQMISKGSIKHPTVPTKNHKLICICNKEDCVLLKRAYNILYNTNGISPHVCSMIDDSTQQDIPEEIQEQQIKEDILDVENKQNALPLPDQSSPKNTTKKPKNLPIKDTEPLDSILEDPLSTTKLPVVVPVMMPTIEKPAKVSRLLSAPPISKGIPPAPSFEDFLVAMSSTQKKISVSSPKKADPFLNKAVNPCIPQKDAFLQELQAKFKKLVNNETKA